MLKKTMALLGISILLSSCGGLTYGNWQAPTRVFAKTATGPLTVTFRILNIAGYEPKVMERSAQAAGAELLNMPNTIEGDRVRVEVRSANASAQSEFLIKKALHTYALAVSERSGQLEISCSVEPMNAPFPPAASSNEPCA